ncbi:MAG: hypothetical protein J6Y92_11065 [Lentisphaeria bacterium]|nr:hypothetical protein [Lentisphaeria bacterium]
MSKIDIKQYYSTKRKRDLVTGSAIALFGILIVFQLYITILFPFQLRHQRLLIAEMEKDEMYEQIDRIRDLVHHTRGQDYAQRGEIKLVEGVMDQFALHVREHGKEMTPKQVGDLRNVLSRYEIIANAWQTTRLPTPEEIEAGQDPSKRVRKTSKYHIRQNVLDTTGYAKELDEKMTRDALPLH